MAISWHLTPKRGIFTAFVQKTWQFHGQKNFLAMKILGHFLKKRSSNWKKHGNFMAFKKKIQKNRNVAELPRFESPDVAFQNFPAATLRPKISQKGYRNRGSALPLLGHHTVHWSMFSLEVQINLPNKKIVDVWIWHQFPRDDQIAFSPLIFTITFNREPTSYT